MSTTNPATSAQASSETTATTTSSSLTPEQWKQRITSFYQFYNPAVVGTVDEMVRKYAGNEEALLKALIKRWGPEPGTTASSAPTTTSTTTTSSSSDQKNQPQQNATTTSAATTTTVPVKPLSMAFLLSGTAEPPKGSTQRSQSGSMRKSEPSSPVRAASPTMTTTSAPSGVSVPQTTIATATTGTTNTSAASTPTATTPTAGSSLTTTSDVVPPPGSDRWRDIFAAYLRKYDAASLSQLDVLLAKYKNKEKEGLLELQRATKARKTSATNSETGSTSNADQEARQNSTDATTTTTTTTTTKTNTADAEAKIGGESPQRERASSSATQTRGGVTAEESATANQTSATKKAYPATEEMFRRRVIRYYQHYRPEKLHEIDKILDNPQYANREYLMKVLASKYGSEPVHIALPPADWQAPVVSVAYPSSTIVPWPVRFFFLYFKFAPDRLSQLPRNCEANAGHEGRWMAVLMREFGLTEEPEIPTDYDHNVPSDERTMHFIQQFSSLFSQFAPSMLPLVRVMAKQPSVVARQEELLRAAREYYLNAPSSPERSSSAASLFDRPHAQTSLEDTATLFASYSRPPLGPNTSQQHQQQQHHPHNNDQSNASTSHLRSASIPHQNPFSRSASSYFEQSAAADNERPRDLVQQAVELVRQNRLLLQLEEPSDSELLTHLANRSASRSGGRRTASQLYDEASALLSQPPVVPGKALPNSSSSGGLSRANSYAARSHQRAASPTTATHGGGGGRGASAIAFSGEPAMVEAHLTDLKARNQQLEELVSQLTSALDMKTTELREVTGGGGRASPSSSSGVKQPAMTQTFDKLKMTHATQTMTLINEKANTTAEEEIASYRAQLGVREHQNRMLRLQLQQFTQELEQKERQLRNALACVDSLTETVNMRMRENASLKLDQIPNSDPTRFLEVVDEIKQAFQLHYQQQKERDESEMNDYYQLATQMISNRDESIQELTKALEQLMDERRKAVTSSLGLSIGESEGEIANADVAEKRSDGTPAGTAAPSHLEKKCERLEKELARANAQLQAQNEEHATLVHALALYSAGNQQQQLSATAAAKNNRFAIANNNSNAVVDAGGSTSSRSATEMDPFSALQQARQRNASETSSIGVSKDEHMLKVERLEAARLEAESARAALTAELHRRSIALEENEKARVETELALDAMKTEMKAAQQELAYWRGEAENRKKDVNRLVEHVATLSDALRQQKEAIASGTYLLAHSQARSTSNTAAAAPTQRGTSVVSAANNNNTNNNSYEFEPERKVVLPVSHNPQLRSSSNAPFGRGNLQQQQQQYQPGSENTMSLNSPNPLRPQRSQEMTQQQQNSLQQPLGHTKANLWSMMYGSDQERVQKAEQVAPYPSLGYHIERADGGFNQNNASITKLILSGGMGTQSQQQQQQQQNAAATQSLNRVRFDPNVTAAASVALARAQIAATTPGIQ